MITRRTAKTWLVFADALAVGVLALAAHEATTEKSFTSWSCTAGPLPRSAAA
jgi:hypothetical protein